MTFPTTIAKVGAFLERSPHAQAAMLHDVFTLKPGLLVETIDDESLVLDMDRNVYFGLNPVALEIWRGLESGHTPNTILTTLTQTYTSIPRETLSLDVTSFLEALLAQGLVTRAQG